MGARLLRLFDTSFSSSVLSVFVLPDCCVVCTTSACIAESLEGGRTEQGYTKSADYRVRHEKKNGQQQWRNSWAVVEHDRDPGRVFRRLGLTRRVWAAAEQIG